jgi:hypothetical protein
MKFLKSSSLLLVVNLFLWFSPLVRADDYTFGELSRLAEKYGTDKGPKGYPYVNKLGMKRFAKGNNYTEVYEYFFYPLKDTLKKYFEIGIESGASLFMARDYFPNAMIYGIDIVDSSKLNSDRIKTFVADQTKRENLKDFIKMYGKDYDLIIDDGGHSMEMQQVSFGYLFPYVKPGGIYIIEDVHTSFMLKEQSGAEPDGSNTTFNMIINFMATGKLRSKYLTQAEQNYLSANIEYCNLFSRDARKHMFCLIKKKR